MKYLRNMPITLFITMSLCIASPIFAGTLNIAQTPLYTGNSAPPLTMIIMDKSHYLYTAAFNDNEDINGDGVIDYKFNPTFNYYGYFDSDKCYAYHQSETYFYPVSMASGPYKTCTGNWSGNFLNYVTMSKLDVFRKILYGGRRVIDAQNKTVLERSYIPQDAHSFGKEYHTEVDEGYNISQFTPFTVPQGNLFHLFANTTLRNSGTGAPLLRVALNQPFHIWDWLGIEAPVAGARAFHGSNGPIIQGITNYVVRVLVCDENISRENNCQLYPQGYYKPIGILQEFGENNAMHFGLLSGSYNNNLQGGVLRKNIASISNEINAQTGQFSSTNGIIATINKLTVYGFGTNYWYDCGLITTRNIQNGECKMWGNPLAEMLYEATRYFAGKRQPTATFDYTDGVDNVLGLPKVTWDDPYITHPYCSKALSLIISASQPAYDSDAIAGSPFSSTGSDLTPSLNVGQLGQFIFSNTGYNHVSAMVGQVGNIFDGTPTPKTVTSFGNIRGLTARDANDQGSFHVASVAYYAWLNDLNPTTDQQNMESLVVAFAQPLAEIKFNIGGKMITLAPFAKSVKNFNINAQQGAFQPSNEIADFYIESLSSNQAVFRINFTDVQQGGDYDMDAVVKYIITVNANQTLTVDARTMYAAGSIVQHLGYVISGTTADGVYLVVRDTDTPTSQDIDYFLDTPPYQTPGSGWRDYRALPTQDVRTFMPGNALSTTFFNSPLWYAAKWGGFYDINDNKIPDLTAEYASGHTTKPDNYISGNNPRYLETKLRSLLTKKTDKTGTIAPTTLNSRTLHNNSKLFVPTFQSKLWEGDLTNYSINTQTGETESTIWKAATVLNNINPDDRVIVSFNPDINLGIKFRWTDTDDGLSLLQKDWLNINPITHQNDGQGPARLAYIRGSHEQEMQEDGLFRNRNTILGDILHAKPTYIGAPALPYPDHFGHNAPENSVPYSTFRLNMHDRSPMIYIGANDGMLHAFDAQTGIEKLAYIPFAVFKNLSKLTHPQYNHHYYVDGTPTVADVLMNGAWRTILAGSLNAGGQGIFTLDITDPSTFNENNASSIVKWEFTDAQDQDMGFSFSQPVIVRLANNQWGAIFGNGYNNTYNDNSVSTTGNAVLYIVNITDGQIMKKFDTQMGMQHDPKNQSRPNGMSTPAVIDTDGNYIADYIYVGDLFGNLWKINITASDPTQWDFSHYSDNKPAPFFVATDQADHHQPITTAPTVSGYAFASGGFKIYFGTGQFIEDADKQDTQVQSIYGLLDNNTEPLTGRNALLQQQILTETTDQRTISDENMTNTHKGWVLDLTVNGVQQGERLLSPVRYMNKKIIFTTLIPNTNPCDYGGKTWMMALSAQHGGRLSFDAFSAPGTTPPDETPPSGTLSTDGLTPMPSILQAGKQEYLYFTGTGGHVHVLTGNPGEQIYGRQSWRQVQ